MTYRDTSADITLDNANMATKEQIARLMADDPSTIAERLSGNYIYPGAISPMRTSPIEQEAGREIVRLRAEIDALKDQVENYKQCADGTSDQLREANIEIKRLNAEVARLKADAERYRFLREQNESPVDEDGAESFYVGRESVFDEGGWIGADLDSVIDSAMKDFSTTTKE